MARDDEGLVRGLNLGQAASIVVGIVIGSGIFVAVHRTAQGVDGVAMLFVVWVGAGLLTLLGALTYAEFGAMFPRTGGDYVYARESLGAFWGFFNGWLAFAINYPASLAALSLAWAMQLEQLKPSAHVFLLVPGFGVKFTALAILAFFTIVNYFGVRQGGWVQFAVTAAKVALMLGLVVLGIVSSQSDVSNLSTSGHPATIGFSLALVGALFAYDGWTGVTRVAGELKDPQRNVPRALILGILGVVAVYVLLVLTYVLVLGFDGMRGEAVASRAAEAVFGAPGKVFVTVMILVSILGPINGLTLAGPRVYYAMARDGLFPRLFARVHNRHRVPHVSILAQTVASGLLVLLFSRDQLFGYVVLASWTAYALTGIGLIRLRRSQPDRPRPYKLPGYPVVPVLFVLASFAFVAYLFVDSLDSPGRILGLPTDFFYFVGNLAVMALAVPVYLAFVRRAEPRPD
jgi:basic amino acid/polyamine antiporter, APA family